MTSYAAKARLNTRKAWITFGKARELQYNMRNGGSAFPRDFDCSMIRATLRTARLFMHTAILYRQMEGRL